MSDGMQLRCEIREALKDLPQSVSDVSQQEILERITFSVRKILDDAKSEKGRVRGGTDDAHVIALMEEAMRQGEDLREHDDFPFRLAARHGRLPVMRFLCSSKETRPSKESLVHALADALDAGHLEAARFCSKRALGGIPSLMRQVEELAAEKRRLSDESERHYKRSLQLEEQLADLENAVGI
jgi:hypothetical protein